MALSMLRRKPFTVNRDLGDEHDAWHGVVGMLTDDPEEESMTAE